MIFKHPIQTMFFTCLTFQCDLNADGTLSTKEVGTAFEKVGEEIPGYILRDIIKEVDSNNDGVLNFDEFLEVRLRSVPMPLFNSYTEENISLNGNNRSSIDNTNFVSIF